jgi:hypothetical protein
MPTVAARVASFLIESLPLPKGTVRISKRAADKTPVGSSKVSSGPAVLYPPTRRMTIIALDPGVVGKDGKIVRAFVDVPNEELGEGPRGYRVQVLDYDSSTGVLYQPGMKPTNRHSGPDFDSFAKHSDQHLLEDPDFHAQNVYAIVMRTLARFEFALGRRVSWSFGGHQIQVAPHAFADANAFYSKRDRALVFGYFPKLSGPGMVYSCLSHDVVAHETTHALVDGLRPHYTDPSSPDQAAFHEGFADIVALLSIFSLSDVVSVVIDRNFGGGGRTIAPRALTVQALRSSVLLGLGEQMGKEMLGVRSTALRRSVEIPPSTTLLETPEFQEPHRRGEALVAAVMNAFLEIWVERLADLGKIDHRGLSRIRVVEEASDIAQHLLTIMIRALDYAPPTDLEFGDFLSAALTSDYQIYPDDKKYGFRTKLRQSFEAYGMRPASKGVPEEPGIWESPDAPLFYNRTHFDSMLHDPDEVFRFLWENRDALKLNPEAYSEVVSVCPCIRVASDGFVLRETVAQYVQMLTVRADELAAYSVRVPDGMPATQDVTLYGGGALVFDQYGNLKYHIRNRIEQPEKQSKRLAYLWKFGAFDKGSASLRRFAAMHRRRMLGGSTEQADDI